MKYTSKSFSVPVGSSKVSEEDWEAIFGKKVKRDITGHYFRLRIGETCSDCGPENVVTYWSGEYSPK